MACPSCSHSPAHISYRLGAAEVRKCLRVCDTLWKTGTEMSLCYRVIVILKTFHSPYLHATPIHLGYARASLPNLKISERWTATANSRLSHKGLATLAPTFPSEFSRTYQASLLEWSSCSPAPAVSSSRPFFLRAYVAVTQTALSACPASAFHSPRLPESSAP